MIRVFRVHVAKPTLALGLFDGLILLLSIILGYSISYFDFSRAFTIHTEQGVQCLFYVIAIMLSLLMMGMYQRQFISDLKITLLRLIASFATAVLAMSILFYVFPGMRIWMSALLPALAIGLIGVFLARVFFVRVVDIDAFKRRVLVFGAGSQAQEIEVFEKQSGFHCVGFLTIGRDEPAVERSRLLPCGSRLIEMIDEYDVDEVVVAIQERRGATPSNDLLACRMQGIQISDFWTFMERQKGQVELDALRPSWMIFSEGFSSRSRVQRIVKRVFDVVVSLLMLLFSLPVTTLAAMAVFAQDRGPIFYRQERVGLYGKTFYLLKFRSMRVDAEKDGVARWASSNDSRVTPVGAFIRLTRIDEIPQIYNVLRGEMSFIGPRPERPTIVEDLATKIQYYNYRDAVKPGITGWAQINYPYGASVEDAKQKLKFDLFYIKNYSLMLDFLILLQTVRVVLWPQGVR
ncbi:MAG: TIGR03013 family PEP-CTERM/XrtA system glycosyltransferase [Alphaproteobacteria bacterium]|nr:TIGR03013 family PEP-CTERM/XrtA system glycosyltransferase [Alphaproteobacteria bacterium]